MSGIVIGSITALIVAGISSATLIYLHINEAEEVRNDLSRLRYWLLVTGACLGILGGIVSLFLDYFMRKGTVTRGEVFLIASDMCAVSFVIVMIFFGKLVDRVHGTIAASHLQLQIDIAKHKADLQMKEHERRLAELGNKLPRIKLDPTLP